MTFEFPRPPSALKRFAPPSGSRPRVKSLCALACFDPQQSWGYCSRIFVRTCGATANGEEKEWGRASQPVVARWLLVLYRLDFDSLLGPPEHRSVASSETRTFSEQTHALSRVAN